VTKPLYKDEELRALIGSMVYDRIARLGDPAETFLAVVEFWNEQTGDHWIAKPDDIVSYNDARLAEVGWFAYQRARQVPDEIWTARFQPAAPLKIEWAPSAEDLSALERRAKIKLICHTLLADTGEILERLGDADLPAGEQLFALDKLAPPKRAWMTLAEIVLAMINGRFAVIANLNDLGEAAPDWMPIELGDLAARVICEAAYRGDI
jgi:hypothetical protein